MMALLTVLGIIALVCADLRWLRVAQREHYLAGSVSRFVTRWWWQSTSINRILLVVGLVGIVAGTMFTPAIVLLLLPLIVGPVGLDIRGRTSKIAFTRRLKTVAAFVGFVQLATVGAALLVGTAPMVAALLAAFTPLIIDLALAALAPWEVRKAEPYVTSARARLRSVAPKVVAITGSYGKTTTKNYVAHLLSGSKTVFATPASFNNRAGLSRAVNEQLSPGTDVFVAEMGTYGFGEIAELCELCPPDIAVLTSIGPVHLERFGSEDNIVDAKSEIFDRAPVCILNVDDERLAKVADRLDAMNKQVWRCSAVDGAADVCVVIEDGLAYVYRQGDLFVDGVAVHAPATNVACAIAVALAQGVEPADIAARLGSLPAVAHRQEVSQTDGGVTVIDDTYNANPASVRRALSLLTEVGGSGRRVIATPGIVELGPRQPAENFALARDAADSATDLIIIGRTNRRALVDGARGSDLNVITVDHLPDAVAWVRTNTGEGDVVAYVNDLPDHFP